MEKIEGLVVAIINMRDIHRPAVVYRKHVVVLERWLGGIVPGPGVESRIEITPVEAPVKPIGTRPANHRELRHLRVFGRVVGGHDLEFLIAFHVTTWKAIRSLAAADYAVHRDTIRAEIVRSIARAIDHNSAATIRSAIATLHTGGYEHYIRPSPPVHALRELGKILRGLDV